MCRPHHIAAMQQCTHASSFSIYLCVWTYVRPLFCASSNVCSASMPAVMLENVLSWFITLTQLWRRYILTYIYTYTHICTCIYTLSQTNKACGKYNCNCCCHHCCHFICTIVIVIVGFSGMQYFVAWLCATSDFVYSFLCMYICMCVFF